MRSAVQVSAVPESFVTQLTEAQFSLFNYIFSNNVFFIGVLGL